jgi:hypothetical protein
MFINDQGNKNGRAPNIDELKSRLAKMAIEFDPTESKKQYYLNLYNDALKNESNIAKIQKELEADAERNQGVLVENKKKHLLKNGTHDELNNSPYPNSISSKKGKNEDIIIEDFNNNKKYRNSNNDENAQSKGLAQSGAQCPTSKVI